jgi:hypothetical protein
LVEVVLARRSGHLDRLDTALDKLDQPVVSSTSRAVDHTS